MEPLVPPVSWLIHVILTPRYFPIIFPQLPGTVTESVCSQPASKALHLVLPVRKCTVNSSALHSRDDASFSDLYIMATVKENALFFKPERVKVLPYNTKVLDMLHLFPRTQDS